MVNGQVVPLSPSDQLASDARLLATATITVGGSITNLDKLRVRIKSGALEIDVTAAMTGGDTTTTAAAKVAAAINANATLRDLGYAASSAAAIVTLTGYGPIPMIVALDSWAESAGLTLTCGGTVTSGEMEIVKFVSDLLPLGYKYVKVLSASTTTARATAIKNAINADVDLANAAITATSSSAIVTIDLSAVDSDVTVTSYAWQPSATVTVGGTPADGNAPILVFTATGLPGGDTTINYTVSGSPTTTQVATALAGVINANSELIAAGITASPSGAVVTVTLPDNIGGIVLSRTNDTTTYTLSAGPTETIVKAAEATETMTISQVFTGGGGPILPTADFQYMYNGQPLSFRAGFPAEVTSDLLTMLLRDAQQIS